MKLVIGRLGRAVVLLSAAAAMMFSSPGAADECWTFGGPVFGGIVGCSIGSAYLWLSSPQVLQVNILDDSGEAGVRIKLRTGQTWAFDVFLGHDEKISRPRTVRWIREFDGRPVFGVTEKSAGAVSMISIDDMGAERKPHWSYSLDFYLDGVFQGGQGNVSTKTAAAICSDPKSVVKGGEGGRKRGKVSVPEPGSVESLGEFWATLFDAPVLCVSTGDGTYEADEIRILSNQWYPSIFDVEHERSVTIQTNYDLITIR